MDLWSDFTSAQNALSDALVASTRSASGLAAEDLSFHRSLDPSLVSDLDRQSARLLNLTRKLLARCGSSDGMDWLDNPPAELIESNWGSIVDVVDGLLEKADTCLDEYNGVLRQPALREPTTRMSAFPSIRSANGVTIHRPKPLKPQLQFDVPPDNNPTKPFRPLLSTKPHAIIPLGESLVARANENGVTQFLHPYETEISNYEFPPFVYMSSEPSQPRPFLTTSATMVEDMEGVLLMLQDLKKSTVIAIDLEHHDAHSYIGIVSLMQISTRDHDWIIDTLKPWRRQLEVLNEAFADPAILKVLHGAFMDILWLQRDLGLYIVGLFDTHHASRVLGFAGGSLAYLLKRFVGFNAQKQYQTADWRVRPLPQNMLDYARSDTHFLLYIFDNMRNELVDSSNFDNHDTDKIQTVLERSKGVALQRYEHSPYDRSNGLGLHGWFGQLQRAPMHISKEQFAVFRRLHQWRDDIARQEDESPHQVMSKNTVMQIAQVLPRDTPALLSVCHPISQQVRPRLAEILTIIREALADLADQPEMHEIIARINAQVDSVPKISLGSDSKQLESVPAMSRYSAFWGATINLADRTSKEQSLPDTFAVAPCASSLPPADVLMTEDLLPIITGSTQVPSALGRPQPELTVDNCAPLSRSERVVGPPQQGPFECTEDEVIRRLRRKAERYSAKTSAISEGVEKPGRVFDYATAPSVLHGSSRTELQTARRGRSDQFNPYENAAQAPIGAGQANRSKAGRSRTFRP